PPRSTLFPYPTLFRSPVRGERQARPRAATGDRGPAPGTARASKAAARSAAPLADSLFDHSEDVEFILDPVVLHRGRAQSASHLRSEEHTSELQSRFDL